MSKISRLSPRFCVPSTLSCVFAVCCLLLSGISRAQQQEDSAPLPAEQIIQILQENPDLLADAKAQIVTSLRDRGYAVTQADITDDRLFSQIRSDDRVRITVSDELKK